MKRSIVVVALLGVFGAELLAGLDSKKAMYIGGTVTGLKEQTEGVLSTQSETAMTFTPKKSAAVTIPYASITGLEYGQKAGRRVGVAIMVSPLALFSKKRKHFMTVSFKDEAGKEHAAVFELGKDIVRTTLTVVEVRSGKEIEYQDDEARKASKG